MIHQPESQAAHRERPSYVKISPLVARVNCIKSAIWLRFVLSWSKLGDKYEIAVQPVGCCNLAALSVFSNSIVTVIGPTPPGTGVT